MAEPFDPTRLSIAEQLASLIVQRLGEGRPAGIPLVQRDRVVDLESGPATNDLPALLLVAYEERPPAAREAGIDTQPNDGEESRTIAFHFALYGRAGEGRTATQATDAMAAWIVHRLCGYCGADSPFHGLADLIRPGARTSQLARSSAPFCLTVLEIQVTTSYLTDDITRRG